MSNPEQISRWRAAMIEAADAASRVTLEYFRAEPKVLNKDDDGGFDPVTLADQGAEELIREVLLTHFPDYGFVGEEHGTVRGRDPLSFVVDPIDGTRAFIAGVPLWSTLIALSELDEHGQCLHVHCGLFDQPHIGERLFGSAAGTERLGPGEQRTPVSTRVDVSLSQAIMMTTDPYLFALTAERQAFEQMRAACRLTRYGADAYAYALLAMGHVDLVMEQGLKPFDIQALVPIIEGAGGVFGNWQGKTALDGGEVLAAASTALQQEALAVISTR